MNGDLRCVPLGQSLGISVEGIFATSAKLSSLGKSNSSQVEFRLRPSWQLLLLFGVMLMEMGIRRRALSRQLSRSWTLVNYVSTIQVKRGSMNGKFAP